ncbi:MAG: hypothetical protein HY587_01555 [Candidatus Omnitrophica bacterium]|nr:hypothetical protein [Candidatus Omnitrophota bacterium]
MTRLAALAISFLLLAYLFRWMSRSRLPSSGAPVSPVRSWKKKKLKPGEIWVQIFETASREEAMFLQMRLEEENIAVTVFEQAKKNIAGTTPPGLGIVVPKEQSPYAQQLIFRYLERNDSPDSKE